VIKKLEMPKNPENKKIKVILEYEPAEDAEKRLQMAFGIILRNLNLKKKKLLTDIHNDVK